MSDNGERLRHCSLLQNYPNPFNPKTRIQFTVPQRTWVFLSVYDILGREVAALVKSEVKTGVHALDWDATSVAGGV